MDGWVTIGTELDTKSFDKEIEQLERKANDLENQLANSTKLGFGSEEVQQLNVELEKTRNKLVSLRQQQAKLGQGEIKEVEERMKKVGENTKSVIRQVGKWALALFSIRSAYNLIRQASSTLAQYDQQYATNLEYIRYVLAQTLAPILKYILNIIRTLLSYINYIAKAWFGINLFANGSAKNFKNAVDSAKAISKSTQSFDEMNIQSDSSSNGNVTPGFDLSSLDIETPEWLKWIADNKDLILVFFLTLGTIIATIKIADFISSFTELIPIFEKIIKFASNPTFLGISLIIIGIALAVKKVIDYLKNPSWENFMGILAGLTILIARSCIIIWWNTSTYSCNNWCCYSPWISHI